MDDYLQQAVEYVLDEELIHASVNIAKSMKSPAATQIVIESLLDFLVEKELKKIKT